MKKLQLLNVLLIVCIAIFAILVFSIFQQQPDSGTEKINKFNSYKELAEFVNKSSSSYYSYYGREGIGGMEIPNAVMEEKDSSSESGGAGDYSATNIQVEGVDEPDIVKNDGKYIYAVSGNKVFIINAYPAESMEIISEINLNKSVSNIFINGNKLVIFSNGHNYIPYVADCAVDSAGMMKDCGGYSESSTIASVYDISDKENPELEDEFSSDGYYVDARMIDKYVYLISSKYIYTDNIFMPSFSANGIKETVSASDVYYFGYSDNNYVFNSIMAINLDNGEYESKVYLTGGSTSLYVSENSIYFTTIKSIGYHEIIDKRIEEVYFEILPNSEISEIKNILDSDEEDYKKYNKIEEIIYEYSNSLTGEEKDKFDSDLKDKIEEFQIKISKELEKTIVHKVSIDGSEINYKGSGEVPGQVLNQFSMDEYRGNFRIATTTGNTWSETSYNHLYVLDEDLKIIGKIEDLAKGERIYSVRFLGSKAYMVTFRQVDPLYVIDLSDSENPEVLGYLKVTGYSSYLHPYDENHIIGVGMEANEQGRTQGMKIALFDVSDFENPKEMSKYEVEGVWSYSPALYDHKAFLFDREKELLVLPISYSEEAGEYNYKQWQGVFVFDINLEEGISLRGKVAHEINESQLYYYYGDYVQRALYMDDVLYTISSRMVKASDLDDLSEINKVEIPYEDVYYRYYGEEGIDEIFVASSDVEMK
ncbi:MAG: beta-propeller domain-containing protein [Candidatus Pacearchaeota archaeon]